MGLSLIIQTALRFASYALCLTALANIVVAQTTPSSASSISTGETSKYSIEVQTTDLAGAVIVSAELSLLDADGRPLRSSLTDERGVTQFSDLPSGRYTVQASARGFKTTSANLDFPGFGWKKIRLILEFARVIHSEPNLPNVPIDEIFPQTIEHSWLLELSPAFSFPLPTPLPPPRPARSPVGHFFSGLGHKLGF
jgi:hypothetical protein